MRFVHTADVHLDACFASWGMPTRLANRRRQSLRDVFHAIVRRAREWPADALLIPGDLFDLERVSRDTIAFLRAEFESIQPVDVFIAPGNHDPYITESPYASETWPDNVHIFAKPEWTYHRTQDGRLGVHGFAFDGYEISSNPFGRLEIAGDGAVHVALAHGTERAHQPPDGKSYAPFDAAAATPKGLAYLALGHFHRVTEIPGAFDTAVHYSGAPEGHGFDEPGPHHYLEVEIDAGAVCVTAVPCSRVVYSTYRIDCSVAASTQEIVEAIRARAEAVDVPQVARITLSGACSPSLAGEFPSVRDTVEQDFEYLVLINETTPLEDYEELARETTALGAFLKRLNDEIAVEPVPPRREMLERAREVGLAAYRNQKVPVLGMDLKGSRA